MRGRARCLNPEGWAAKWTVAGTAVGLSEVEDRPQPSTECFCPLPTTNLLGLCEINALHQLYV